MRILDDYGVDGLYNDAGYFTSAVKARFPESSPLKAPAEDEISCFEETPQYNGALTDLLALIYAEVKRRGGIFKLHVDGALEPQTGGQKVYDYLWVGEGVNNADGPHVYSGWDAVPPHAETRPTDARWLKRYLPRLG